MSRPEPDPPFRHDLDAALAAAWRRLTEGAEDRRHPFHTVQLASLDESGAPRLRTVVLRAAEAGAARLRLHTDRRSGKIAGLRRDPRVELHAYDPGSRLQLRAAGRATLHEDDAEADAAWAASAPGSRVCYRATAPGTPLERPGEADPDARARDPKDAEAGRDNFAALTVNVERLELVHLSVAGHRRAEFRREGDGWRARWLAP